MTRATRIIRTFAIVAVAGLYALAGYNLGLYYAYHHPASLLGALACAAVNSVSYAVLLNEARISGRIDGMHEAARRISQVTRQSANVTVYDLRNKLGRG